MLDSGELVVEGAGLEDGGMEAKCRGRLATGEVQESRGRPLRVEGELKRR